MKTVDQFDFNHKKALVRVDFNVPLDDDFRIVDATRIEAAKATIDKIMSDGGSAILVSHLGRPKGKQDKFSLGHIASEVGRILGHPLTFVSDSRGEEVTEAAKRLSPGKILLLENLRFYK